MPVALSFLSSFGNSLMSTQDPFADVPQTGQDPFADAPQTGQDPFADQPQTGQDPFADEANLQQAPKLQPQEIPLTARESRFRFDPFEKQFVATRGAIDSRLQAENSSQQ